jgi:internalin A
MSDKETEEIYYYEFIKGNSSKFWEITIKRNAFITRYGRIGTKGRETVKEWDSSDIAYKEATKLRKSKEEKGYVLKEKEKKDDLTDPSKRSEPFVEKEWIVIGEKRFYVIDGHLDLSDKKINNISEIIGLNDLESLKSLDLSGNFIESISGFDNLNNLRYLNLDQNLITKIQGLDNLVNLEEFIIGRRLDTDFGISKLEGLDNLKNLRKLTISVIFLKEISGLENLGNLEELTIICYGHTTRFKKCNVVGLSNHPNLKRIVLQGIRIKTLEHFKDLEQLEELTARDCDIEEINHLSKLNNLKFLDLSKNFPIEEIKGLDSIINLTELYINDCFQIKRIDGLDSLKNLKVLSLNHNQITFIENLEMLQNLQKLDLSSNKINLFQGIGTLNKLEELNLDYNSAYAKTGLQFTILEENLPKLKILHLNRTRIKSLDEISKLSKLEELYIDDNRMESLEPLKKLKHLRVLTIHDNRIYPPEGKYKNRSDLSSLRNMTSLEVLDLSRNDIIDINDLTGLFNLKELDLFLNRGVDISLLSKITSLEKLRLYACDIKDLSPLKSLKNLKELDLQDNELESFEPIEHLEKLETVIISRDQLESLSSFRISSRLLNLFYYYKVNSNKLSKVNELEDQIDLVNQRRLKEKQEKETKKMIFSTLKAIKTYFTSGEYDESKKKVKKELKGWFTEDYIDQELYTFFNEIEGAIVYTYEEQYEAEHGKEIDDCLEDPDCPIDPNLYIDEAITEAEAESRFRYKEELQFLDDLIKAYSEDFLLNARKWMLMNLEEFILENFNIHALKFTSQSIEKLVEAGIRNSLHSQFSLIHLDLNTIDHWMMYLDGIFSSCEDSSLDYQKFLDDLKKELYDDE